MMTYTSNDALVVPEQLYSEQQTAELTEPRFLEKEIHKGNR